MKKVAVTRVDKNEFFSDEKELIIKRRGVGREKLNKNSYQSILLSHSHPSSLNIW